MISYLEHLKRWAADLQESVVALYLAAKEPDTPRLAKWVIAITVAYALSPIDLILDFIPVLGYLDDLLILPLGIWIAIRLIPDEIWRPARRGLQRRRSAWQKIVAQHLWSYHYGFSSLCGWGA